MAPILVGFSAANQQNRTLTSPPSGGPMSAQQLQNYIAGEWIAGATSSKDVNPSDTSDVIAEYAQADKAQTERAIEAARAAFRTGLFSMCRRVPTSSTRGATKSSPASASLASCCLS